MAVQTQIDALDEVIREEMSFVERRTEPEVDGIFNRIYTTSEGVTREGIGRDFKVIHTFSTGLAGAFLNAEARGDNLVDSDRTGQSQMMSVGTTFPTVAESVLPGYLQKTITLVQGLGTFVLPIHIMQADVLDASIAKVVALTIQGTAKKIAQSEAISFYSINSGNGASQAIFTLNGKGSVLAAAGATADGPVANGSIVFDMSNSLISGGLGRIANIMPGMLLDQFVAAGTQSNTTGGGVGLTKLLVGRVDYLAQTFVVHSVDAITYEHDDDTDLVSGDYFVLKGTGGASNVGFGPSGIDYWTVNSGTVFGIALATYPQFKSVVTAVGGVLDGLTLNTNWGTFYDAYGSMNMIDSVLTTAGVINQYFETIDGLGRYQRNGEKLKVREGWMEWEYDYQGLSYDLLISRYVTKGYLYGLKLRNQNLKRYVPPGIPGAGKRSEFSQEIQWYAPLAGSSSIFLPARSSDAIAQYVEAPFFNFREICPEQIPGIKLTGLTEAH